MEDYPDYPKIIEALISGESGSEIPSGKSSRTYAPMTHHPNHLIYMMIIIYLKFYDIIYMVNLVGQRVEKT